MDENTRDTDQTRQETGNLAEEIPSRNLPPVTYKDLPEPLPLWKILGPGVIAIAIGLAAGEFVLWPYITSIVGLVFLWGAVVSILTQVFINMEIERYTLATGETAVTGFSRFWKPWGLIICLVAIAQYAWPGWATSASTVLTFALGGGNVALISVISLFIIGILLTASPVVYKTVERVEFFKVGAVVFFLVVVIVGVISLRAWGDLPGQFVGGFGRIPEGLSAALVLGAIAAAGAGGAHNLVLSNWARDKGYGMGVHIPRLVSPITGEEVAAPSIGYMFPQDEENLSRWKIWWRRANIEQWVGFFLIGTITITIMSLLAYATVYGMNLTEEPSLDFLQAEGRVLGETIGGWFQIFFYVIGTISLYGAAFGVLDIVSRLVSDVLKVGYLAESTYWSESKIYFAVVWGEILLGSLILLLGLVQPIILLVISTAAGGVVTFLYSMLLIKLNRSALPGAIKLRGGRLGAMIWAVAFYGFFSILLVISQIRSLIGG